MQSATPYFGWLFFSMALAIGCYESQSHLADFVPCTDQPLFGAPNAMTGLNSAECRPSCACDAHPWEAPVYGEVEVNKALSWTLLNPPDPLTADPYASSPPPEDGPDTVCGVLPDAPGSRAYRLLTYDSADAARAAGAFPTHFGSCGLCSPLVDLAVYMRVTDLTAPVRQCGIDHLNSPPDDHIACLMDLGFDLPCAQIWYYNTVHTRLNCFTLCLNALNMPYNLPDGSLNPCLACDEAAGGPVFKAAAGRTRRNTGIPSAICRPCTEAQALVHDYL